MSHIKLFLSNLLLVTVVRCLQATIGQIFGRPSRIDELRSFSIKFSIWLCFEWLGDHLTYCIGIGRRSSWREGLPGGPVIMLELLETRAIKSDQDSYRFCLKEEQTPMHILSDRRGLTNKTFRCFGSLSETMTPMKLININLTRTSVREKK